MTDRDRALLALRPTIDVSISPASGADPDAEMTETVAFFHQTLRPVLKLQNETLLALVRTDVDKRVPGFADLPEPDRRARLAATLRSDSRLKRVLLGVVLGMLTADELAFALAHEAEIRRRIVALLAERIDSQSDRV